PALAPPTRAPRRDGGPAGGNGAATRGDGPTGCGCRRTSGDMTGAQASLRRRSVAGALALLLVVPSGLLAADPEPAPPYPPPRPPIARPVPPPPPPHSPPPP